MVTTGLPVSLSLPRTEFLKGLAILFVIIGHLEIFPTASWGVGLFLFLSGFGITRSFLEKGLGHYFVKKILSLWLPYFCVLMIVLLIDYLQGMRYPLTSILWSLAGLNMNPQIDAAMWFIGYIIIWYIAFYLIFTHIRADQTKKIGLALAAVLIPIFLLSIPPVAIKAAGAWWYIFEFPLGILVALKYENIQQFSFDRIRWFVILLLGAAAILVCYRLNGYLWFFLNIYLTTFFFIGLGSVLILREGVFLGRISYEIYLLEAIFIWKYKFLFFSDMRWLNNMVYLAFLIFISYLFSKLMGYITGRLKTPLFRLIRF